MHECLPRCLSAETIHRLIQTSLRLTETETHTHHFETCTDCWNRYLAGASPLPTVEVPGFLVTEEIGRGAASVVYAAWRCSMPVKLVALKVLWLTDEGQRVRFEREAAIHKRLDSPDIVKCFNIGSHGPFAYYEMEFIRGEPLDVYLSLCARTMRQKLVVFERVCRALAFAHESGVVHRDLKPSNILVDAAGRPHILDFGLGAIHSNDWSHRSRGTQTKLGDVIGTIKYMSPEQAWGGLIGGPIDHRSDIWALGVILCEIATGGVHPYSLAPTTDRCDEEALLHSIRTELPKLPPIADSELASSLKTLIERCLLWDKEYRIQSARELADDVQRCLCQCEIRTKRVPMGYRARRILTECAIHRRSLLWLSNVVATLVLLSVTLLVGNVRWRESDSTMLSNWGAKHVGAAQGFTRDDIVVVGISDDSVRLVPDRARQLGFSGLSDDVRTWRALHGSIMQELAEARPAGVVWDFYFRTPRAEDLAFVEGIESLRRHGVPVVLAVDNILEDGNPELSPTIVNGLKDVTHFGGILARDMVSRPGEFVLAVRRGEVVVPSLALATVSALAHPGRQLFVEWSERTPSLTLRYREPGKDAVLSLQHRLNLRRADAREVRGGE